MKRIVSISATSIPIESAIGAAYKILSIPSPRGKHKIYGIKQAYFSEK